MAAMLRVDNPRERGGAARSCASTSAGISPKSGKDAGLEAGRNPRRERKQEKSAMRR